MNVIPLPPFELTSAKEYTFLELKGAFLVSAQVEALQMDLYGTLTISNGKEDVILNPLNGKLIFQNPNIGPGQRVFITYTK